MLLAAQTAENINLNRRVLAPGAPHPIHVGKADIPNTPPSNEKLWSVVWGLQNGHATGASGLLTEHIKLWLHDVMPEEEEGSDVGLGDKWHHFVRLMKAIW